MNNRYKALIRALSFLAVGGCAAFFVYMTLFRWVDYVTCIIPMARKVGVPSTMDGIESYITETANPGMEREEVLRILEGLGPVDVRFQSASYPANEFRDTIFIESCIHPLNNLEIFAFYNSESRLISISLLNND